MYTTVQRSEQHERAGFSSFPSSSRHQDFSPCSKAL
jgi:hypothetical protein